MATEKSAKQQLTSDSYTARAIASPLLAAIVIFVLAFGVYLNTLGHEFVWDDRDLIVDNPTTHELTLSTVKDVFTRNFWQNFQQSGGYYRPLVTLSYHVNYQVFSGNPMGFHFVNVFWNAMVAVLLFLFVSLLFRNAVTGIAAALLFAVHPIHTESVAWIAGRTDVFAAVWGMTSLLFYVLGRRAMQANIARGAIFALISLTAFFMAMLSKESAVFLPFVLFVLELPPCASLINEKKERIPRFIHPLPYLGVLALYLYARQAALGTLSSTYEAYADGVAGSIGLPLSILAGYIYKLILPLRLSAEYDAPVPESMLSLPVLLGFAALAGIIFVLIRYRRNAGIVFGSLFFLLGLAPVLNLIPIGEIAAERFLYFPSVGFCIAIAALVTPALLVRHPDWGLLPTVRVPVSAGISRETGHNVSLIFTVVVLIMAGRTVIRNFDWRSETVLFAKTVAASPESARAHLNVGNAARRAGLVPDAIAAYQRALEIDPDYPDAISNLAGTYAQLGSFDQARALMEKAVETHPENVGLRSNLGGLYYQEQKWQQAAKQFEAVLEIEARAHVIRFNLARVRYNQGKLAAARRHFERVATQGDEFMMSFYYLAVIENTGGRSDRARDYAQRFVDAYPRDDAFMRSAREILAGTK